jgi:hypothetical protein
MNDLPIINDAKRTFWKKGACSHTLFFLINRHFDNLNPAEERASDPLAGGILQKGHQCGMLWGASLAIGKEANNRFGSSNKASLKTLKGTIALMDSFLEFAENTNCKEITHCDFGNRWSFTKYLVTGRFLKCFNLAEDWTPAAIATIEQSLDEKEKEYLVTNCASEVLKKMNALEEEVVMVSGFAGGLGLSGNACGALAASIWYTTLLDILNNPPKSALKNVKATKKLDDFLKFTNGKISCQSICGKKFKTIKEHSDYIQNGGCSKLIERLAI